MAKEILCFCVFVCGILLGACGGGSSHKEGRANLIRPSPIPSVDAEGVLPEWVQLEYKPSSEYKGMCALPRSGTNSDGEAYGDQQGSERFEKFWLRSWSNETYLWYDEIGDWNPGRFGLLEYFYKLRSQRLNKDRFHFAVDTDEWEQLSQSGISFGYGMEVLAFVSGGFLTDDIRVAFVEPGSPADEVGLKRGASIRRVDDVSVYDIDSEDSITRLNNGLFPLAGGLATHDFTVVDLGSELEREITMTAREVESAPVLLSKSVQSGDQKVGYLLFNDHIATSEDALINAVEQLASDQVDELVLDLRYNGGGYLAIASQLAYMISGRGLEEPVVFYEPQFNDKHPAIDPVTKEPILALPFISESIGLSRDAGEFLPSLNLNRVVVIIGPDTCSASEAIINGLRGVGVDVGLVGDKTCGKPYGFYPQDNCGTTYFTIQFTGVNALGFGDYAQGFEAEHSKSCDVADDLDHALGDSEEARFAAALRLLDSGSCDNKALNMTSNKTSVSNEPIIRALYRKPERSSAIWTH
ncbi:S41 family peptidase [Agaribacterium sp. ZY112]|uniref:S41 family peptidase n=1 Tax=Agaribacterium sp. ZY112 TaxID=3233574 RepID=UPI0035238ED8